MKLLVNAPSGKQEIIEVGEGGAYFDQSRVLWDERTDGELPAITLGGMVRNGVYLEFNQEEMDGRSAITQGDKDAKSAEINKWRLAANKSTFTHLGKVIACDELSRGDIDAVANTIALTGAFPANFPGAWKAVDNTYLPLPSVAAFKAMYASMTAQGTANFNRAQQLKAAVTAAETQADLDAIVW